MTFFKRGAKIASRILLILLAYLIASVIAAVFALVLVAAIFAAMAGRWTDGIGIGSESLGTAVIAWVVTALGAIPTALPAIIYAESLEVRRFKFYAVCGVLAAMIAFLLFAVYVGEFPSVLVSALVSGALLVAGLVGAGVYWSIAGRTAGEWRSLPLRTV